MELNNILSFVSSLTSNRKGKGSLKSIGDTVTDLYTLSEKEFKEQKKRDKKEDRDRKKERREKKRREADKGGKGLLSQIFGKKEERKKSGDLLTNLLLAGGALLGVGVITWNYREEIMEYFNETLKPWLQEKIDEGVDWLRGELEKWTESMKRQARGLIDDLIMEPLAEGLGRPIQQNVQEPLQEMVAGSGRTREGNVFTLLDLTTYRDNVVRTSGGMPKELVEPFNETSRRLKIDKSLNDQLYRRREELEQVKKVGGPGSPSRIRELERIIAETKTNRKQNRTFMTEAWSKLGYADSDLIETQRKQGRYDDQGYIFRQTGGEVDPKVTRPTKAQRVSVDGLFNGVEPERHQHGGAVGKATKVLMKDEALSSLTKGPNDYIMPGGNSVVSRKPWSSVKPDTPIHAYTDSVGVHTIGWGSTYYDNIMNGKQKVKLGDTITKKKADDVLATNVSTLANTYSQKIPMWKKMSQTQQAGILTLGYNAPNAPIGSYPKLTAALKAGDMAAAAANVDRGGPNAARIAEERKMILAGPRDLNQVSTPAPAPAAAPKASSTPQQQPNAFQRFGNWITQPFRKQTGGIVSPRRYQTGGVVGGKGSSITARFSQANQDYNAGGGNIVARPVVVVKRKASSPLPVDKAPAPASGGGSGGLNMVEASQALHRIQSGSKY